MKLKDIIFISCGITMVIAMLVFYIGNIYGISQTVYTVCLITAIVDCIVIAVFVAYAIFFEVPETNHPM